MATDQQQMKKDENRETHVVKDIVPKMATHFEFLAKESNASGKKNRGESETLEKDRNTQVEKNRGDMKTEEEKKDTQLKENRGSDRETEQPISLDEISKYRQEAQQKSIDAILAAQEKGKEMEGNVAGKDGQAEESVLEATTQYLAEKGGGAKDVVLGKGQQACVAVKDYTVQAAGKARDVSVETGKGAAGYAGKVAVDVKDKAVVAGWGAAHVTANVAVEGTKMAASAVASVGQKAVGVAAATGESLKGYTARKQDEAKRDLEAKKSQGEEAEEEEMIKEVSQFVGEGGRELQSDSNGEKQEECQRVEQGNKESECQETKFGVQQEGTDTGVLGAIGETIVEIAQTAKGLVIGEDQTGAEAGYQGSTTKHKKQ